MTDVSIFDGGKHPPCPDDFNLAGYVLAHAEDLHDKIALEVVGRNEPAVWSYGQLSRAVLGTAGAFRSMGLPKNSRILLRVGNTVDFPILFLGAIAAGYVPVPTSSQLTRAEVEHIANDLDPAVVCFGKGIEMVEGLSAKTITPDKLDGLKDHAPTSFEAGSKDRLAYIIYTSGTSGRPRAVQHAHRAVWARRMMWDGWYGLRNDDRLFHAGAFNWTYTLGTGLMDPWAIGATAIVTDGTADRFSLPGFTKKSEATIFAATPGVLRQVLGATDKIDAPKLRHALSAGEKLPDAVRSEWKEKTGTPVYEAMGMSEISTFLSSSPAHQAIQGAIGRPQPGRKVAVIDEISKEPVQIGQPGILAVTKDDPGLMIGYLNAPKETADKFAGGWFLTGDTVSMSKDGSITFLGRFDDMMNAGGYRVSPLEVEAVLNNHKDILESAACAVQIKANTFVIAAFYRAAGSIDQNKLSDHCAKSLASYKCPRLFVHLDELPKGANGKIRRSLLKERVQSDQT